jgi:GTP-binding protein HflX
MGKIYGTTAGLKSSHKKQLQNLYRRKLNPARLILPEQARDLSRLTADLGRQIGLVLNRKGGVERVIAGQPQSLPIPDMTRFRRGLTRLVGYSLLHTVLGPPQISPELQARLAVHWWDYVAVMGVDPDGLPDHIALAHLLPEEEAGKDVRHFDLFRPGQAPEDLSKLVRSLEEELTRISPAHHLSSSDRAILLKVSPLPKDEAMGQISELHELSESAGIAVVGQVVQRRPKPDPRTVLGPGKLEEVLVQALRLDANLLIFDQNLSPSQAHRLARATPSDIRIIDRTQLILDIFAQRAHSREGKLQVEMAQLKYLNPRLGSRDDGLSRLTGGIGGRGPGETRLEIDRRRVRQRLGRLSKDLKQVALQRKRRRSLRNTGGVPVISIVGYTNAGKSTLLNSLTNSEVLAGNRLFATLDPTSRRLRFPKEHEVIITDTVGFIRDLPPELRKAFTATLEELYDANLLLHLADASNPMVEQHIQAVNETLEELDLNHKPRILVLNKMDAAPEEELEALTNRHKAMAISALKRKTLVPLLSKLEEQVQGLDLRQTG